MEEVTDDKVPIDYTLSPDDEGFVDYELPEDYEHCHSPESDREYKRGIAQLAKALTFIVDKMQPKFKILGYEWVGQKVYLPVPPNVTGLFRKHLGEGVYTFVEYMVTHSVRMLDDSGPCPKWEDTLGFMMELCRNKAERPLEAIHYPNRLRLRLRNLLQVHYGLELYPHFQDSWLFDNAEELSTQLEESFSLFRQYGLPWLEDLTTKNPY